jgi:putative ABC transport system permease protein
MWSNYALALYRTLTRHRLYALLNTLGLAFGIAVFAVLALVVRFESSFDHWVPHGDRVFRVNQIGRWSGRPPHDSPGTQIKLMPRLVADFPQIAAGARLMNDSVVVRQGAQQAYETIVYADPTIWDVFPAPFAAGDRGSALADTSSVVVTQAIARKYFGTDRALGRTLTIVLNGQPLDFRVSGVLRDLPPDSNLVLDVVIRLDPNRLIAMLGPDAERWGSNFLFSFVRLRSAADAATVSRQLPSFVDREVADDTVQRPASRHLSYELVPLRQVHFRDADTQDAFRPGVDRLFVAALGVMGLVTLLIAVTNYVSLATARAGMRAREVAIRKVMGATRRMLIWQFIAESVVVALVAGLIAAALVELALPGVGAILGEPIRIDYFGTDGVLAPLLGLCLLVGLAAGIYPALALSRFRPAAVLASARAPGGGRAGSRMREALAVGQFAGAICLMICTAVIFGQMQYLRSADVGFHRDGLLIVRGLGDKLVAPQISSIIEAFRRTPGVLTAAASDRRPLPENNENGNVTRVTNPQISPTLLMEQIGPDYLKTYGVKVLAGRALDVEHRADVLDEPGVSVTDRGLNIMINRSAVEPLGFARPALALGQRVVLGGPPGKPLIGTIVGVVDDVRFVSPRSPVAPQFYMLDEHYADPKNPGAWSAAIRVRDGDQAQVLGRLERVWRQLAPGAPFQGETVQVTMKPFYDSDARRGQLFAAGAVLSAAIACLGLYGLAAFNTSRRVKEIGIRKTLGASTADVLRLLVGEFLRPVLWANLIAWPAAYLAMRWWLAGFDQRIALNPAYFLIPSLAALLVAVLTVAEQAIRVSRAEPSRALRYE